MNTVYEVTISQIPVAVFFNHDDAQNYVQNSNVLNAFFSIKEVLMTEDYKRQIERAHNSVVLSCLMDNINFELFKKYGVGYASRETYLETSDRISEIAPEYAELFALAETKWCSFCFKEYIAELNKEG
jgi:hypothetical protein